MAYYPDEIIDKAITICNRNDIPIKLSEGFRSPNL